MRYEFYKLSNKLNTSALSCKKLEFCRSISLSVDSIALLSIRLLYFYPLRVFPVITNDQFKI